MRGKAVFADRGCIDSRPITVQLFCREKKLGLVGKAIFSSRERRGPTLTARAGRRDDGRGRAGKPARFHAVLRSNPGSGGNARPTRRRRGQQSGLFCYRRGIRLGGPRSRVRAHRSAGAEGGGEPPPSTRGPKIRRGFGDVDEGDVDAFDDPAGAVHAASRPGRGNSSTTIWLTRRRSPRAPRGGGGCADGAHRRVLGR